MTLRRLRTNPLMSQAVIHAGVIYLAGQVDLEQPAATVSEQTRRVLARIDQLLAEAGSSKHHLLSATIWLTDIASFGAMNQAWERWLPAGCAPVRATVQAGLALPGLLVEVSVVAALADSLGAP
jgi:enamine deaminase RidA (YjgF/YER057c/UK114 family)